MGLTFKDFMNPLNWPRRTAEALDYSMDAVRAFMPGHRYTPDGERMVYSYLHNHGPLSGHRFQSLYNLAGGIPDLGLKAVIPLGITYHMAAGDRPDLDTKGPIESAAVRAFDGTTNLALNSPEYFVAKPVLGTLGAMLGGLPASSATWGRAAHAVGGKLDQMLGTSLTPQQKEQKFLERVKPHLDRALAEGVHPDSALNAAIGDFMYQNPSYDVSWASEPTPPAA